jgi:hypothetical protein
MNLSLTEKLRIAGEVAPTLRDIASGERKRIKTTDPTGRVVRVISRVDLAKMVLERAGIEFDVLPGKRPTHKLCSCGSLLVVPPKGKIPEWCAPCLADRYRCTNVVEGKRCEARLRTSAWWDSNVARRNGRPRMCRVCRYKAHPEQRSEAARKREAAMSPERRSERARKAQSGMTSEQRSAMVRKAQRAWTSEFRSELSRKGKAKMTSERRSAIARIGSAAARKVNSALTPEQRSEMARKGHATRRAKQAKK